MFLPVTPDKRDMRSEEFVRRPAGATPTSAEAGNASPTVSVGGSANGPTDDLRAPGQGNAMFRSGGLSGSLGGDGGLSAGGHFNSGGGPGGLGTAGDWQGRRLGQSGVAPAWKMAPPSRSESPGPGSTAPMMARPYYQGGGSTGAPTPTQFAPVQGRTSSPFSAGNHGYVPLQRRSPSPPPRQGAALLRGSTGTNVYGGTRESGMNQNSQMAGGAPQNSHTPRPSRMSGLPGVRGLMTGGSAAADAMDYSGMPHQQLSAAPDNHGLGGLKSDDHMNGDGRFGLGDMGGSGRHASPVAAAGGPPGARTSSPMPQASVVLRPGQHVRGLSPSPMRNLGGLDAGYMQQRSSSPMHQQGSSGTAMPGNAPGATRGISGQTAASVDAAPGGAPGHFWQSPRTASPSASVFRQPEVYPRGRSHTRALSPSQPSQPGIVYGANPVGLTRTMSPTGGMPGRAGIAWSPVPPSPPAPKRSISPQPSSMFVTGHNNSVSSLRWEPQRLRC